MAKPKLQRGKWCFERSTPGNWWVDFKLAGHPRVREPLPAARSKGEAEALASRRRQTLALIDDGLVKADDVRETCTTEAAMARFYDEVSKTWASHETADGYGRRLVESFGNVTLKALNRQHIINHVLKRQRGYTADGVKFRPVSDGTIGNEIDYLKQVVQRARKDWELAVADVDLGGLGLTGKQKRSVGTLSVQKEQEIFRYVRTTRPDYYPPFLFTFMHGKRRGNVIGLKHTDTAWEQGEHGVVRQVGKSRRGQKKILVTPLTAESAALIRAQEGLHPVYVFTWVCKRSRADQGLIAGRRYPFREETLRRFWLDLRTDLKLPEGYRFHDIRHQVGTLIRDLTGDITKSRDVLGHSDLGTTQRYIEGETSNQYAALVALQAARNAAAGGAGPKPRGAPVGEQIAALEQQLAELRARQVATGGNVVPLKRVKA